MRVSYEIHPGFELHEHATDNGDLLVSLLHRDYRWKARRQRGKRIALSLLKLVLIGAPWGAILYMVLRML